MFKRTTAFLTLFTFLATNIAMGVPDTVIASPEGAKQSQTEIASTLLGTSFRNDISEFGTVRRIFLAEEQRKIPEPFVVFIHDVHAEPETQRNIGKIIAYYHERLGIDTMLLEGASGRADLTSIRAFPRADIKEELAGQLLRQAKLTGAEFEAIVSPKEYQLIGLEEREMYERHGKAFIENSKFRAQNEKMIADYIKRTAREKEKVFNKELLEFDRLMSGKHIKPPAQPALESVSFLGRRARELGVGFDHIKQVRLFLRMHVLNSFIQLPWLDAGKHERDRYVKKLSELQTQFNAELFSSEFEDLTFAVKEKLFKNDFERRLDQKFRHLILLEKLVRLEMTPKDWQEYKVNVILSEAKNLKTEILRQKMPQDDNLNLHFAEEFYRLAEARDEILARHAVEGARRTKRAFLITGGFHGQVLEKALEKSGISFVSILPEVSQLPNSKLYTERMAEEAGLLSPDLVQNWFVPEALKHTRAPQLLSFHPVFQRAFVSQAQKIAQQRGLEWRTGFGAESAEWDLEKVRKWAPEKLIDRIQWNPETRGWSPGDSKHRRSTLEFLLRYYSGKMREFWKLIENVDGKYPKDVMAAFRYYMGLADGVIRSADNTSEILFQEGITKRRLERTIVRKAKVPAAIQRLFVAALGGPAAAYQELLRLPANERPRDLDRLFKKLERDEVAVKALLKANQPKSRDEMDERVDKIIKGLPERLRRLVSSRPEGRAKFTGRLRKEKIVTAPDQYLSENNPNIPSIAIVMAFARELGVSIDRLLDTQSFRIESVPLIRNLRPKSPAERAKYLNSISGLSRAEQEKLTRLHVDTIVRFEKTGDSARRLETFLKLSFMYGVSPGQLMGSVETGDLKPKPAPMRRIFRANGIDVDNGTISANAANDASHEFAMATVRLRPDHPIAFETIPGRTITFSPKQLSRFSRIVVDRKRAKSETSEEKLVLDIKVESRAADRTRIDRIHISAATYHFSSDGSETDDWGEELSPSAQSWEGNPRHPLTSFEIFWSDRDLSLTIRQRDSDAKVYFSVELLEDQSPGPPARGFGAKEVEMEEAVRQLDKMIRRLPISGFPESLKGFSDGDIEAIRTWFTNKDKGLLPSDKILRKLWSHILAMRFYAYERKSQGVEQRKITEDWIRLLAKRWGIEESQVDALLVWFVRSDIKPWNDQISNTLLRSFLQAYLENYAIGQPLRARKGALHKMLPSAIPAQQKLVAVIRNIEQASRLFSPDFVRGRKIFKVPLKNSPYFLVMYFGTVEDPFRIVFALTDKDLEKRPLAGKFFQITVDIAGDNISIVTMKGVKGRGDVINESFPKDVGMRPGKALLYSVIVLSEVIGFEHLLGLRGEHHTTAEHGKPLDYSTLHQALGLRWKFDGGRYKDMTSLLGQHRRLWSSDDVATQRIRDVQESSLDLIMRGQEETSIVLRSGVRLTQYVHFSSKGFRQSEVEPPDVEKAIRIAEFTVAKNFPANYGVDFAKADEVAAQLLKKPYIQTGINQLVNDALRSSDHQPVRVTIERVWSRNAEKADDPSMLKVVIVQSVGTKHYWEKLRAIGKAVYKEGWSYLHDLERRQRENTLLDRNEGLNFFADLITKHGDIAFLQFVREGANLQTELYIKISAGFGAAANWDETALRVWFIEHIPDGAKIVEDGNFRQRAPQIIAALNNTESINKKTGAIEPHFKALGIAKPGKFVTELLRFELPIHIDPRIAISVPGTKIFLLPQEVFLAVIFSQREDEINKEKRKTSFKEIRESSLKDGLPQAFASSSDIPDDQSLRLYEMLRWFSGEDTSLDLKWLEENEQSVIRQIKHVFRKGSVFMDLAQITGWSMDEVRHRVGHELFQNQILDRLRMIRSGKPRNETLYQRLERFYAANQSSVASLSRDSTEYGQSFKRADWLHILSEILAQAYFSSDPAIGGMKSDGTVYLADKGQGIHGRRTAQILQIIEESRNLIHKEFPFTQEIFNRVLGETNKVLERIQDTLGTLKRESSFVGFGAASIVISDAEQAISDGEITAEAILKTAKENLRTRVHLIFSEMESWEHAAEFIEAAFGERAKEIFPLVSIHTAETIRARAKLSISAKPERLKRAVLDSLTTQTHGQLVVIENMETAGTDQFSQQRRNIRRLVIESKSGASHPNLLIKAGLLSRWNGAERIDELVERGLKRLDDNRWLDIEADQVSGEIFDQIERARSFDIAA